MKIKWIVGLLVLAFLLTACGGGGAPATEATGTDAAAGTDAVTEAGAQGDVLVMATNAQFPPYEFYEGDKIVGIDPEIAQAIAEKLGMELRIDDMEFGAIIPAVATGKADIALAGMTVDETRKQSVNFTMNYAKGIQAIIVREGSEIKGPDDLQGKKIGVQLSTTGDIYASDEFGIDNVEKFNKGPDAVLALTQEKIDAVIIDIEPAKAFAKANQGLVVLETAFADEDYAIAIGKENEDLLKRVDEALKELIEDGTVQKIIDKYIQ